MVSTPDLSQNQVQALQDIANKLRVHSIVATSAAGSGHPTSCASAAEVTSVLFFDIMKYDAKHPRDPHSDRFILSKGHAAPLLYAAWAEAGFVDVNELKNLRKVDHPLEGHPTPRLEFVDVATGSLGQGLSCGAGIAYTGKYIDHASYRTFVVIGDGEAQEGSVWEAAHFAGHYKLDNLVAVFDVNRLGQSEPTSLQHRLDVYAARLKAFGWHVIVVDGHSVQDLHNAFVEAENTKGAPTVLVAKTYKGKGIPGIEDQDNWHGKALGKEADAALTAIRAQIKNPGPHGIVPRAPTQDAPQVPANYANVSLSEPPNYKLGQQVATRVAYGTALAKIGKGCNRVVALDGDVKNSTYSQKFKDVFPERFIECFIAEQNMVGVATGCGTRNRTIPFCSTFATFFTRAFDHIRMGAISQANVKFCGSHVGVSIGEDGPSQMGLEDIALFRTIPNAVIFYPSDAVSTERAVELAARYQGIVFIRTSRPNAAVLYDNNEPFQIGQAKIVNQSATDRVLIVASAVTLTESLAAAQTLSASGINVRILDPFTIKPFDVNTLVQHAQQVEAVVVVEEHYPEGGIGEAVLSSFASVNVFPKRFKHLCVRELPRSGSPEALVAKYGLDAKSIVAAVHEVLA